LTILRGVGSTYDNELESLVPIFMIERTFAEKLEPSFDAAEGIIGSTPGDSG
jgi:hypothetical protein